MTEIILPWPHPTLSPNNRSHWSVKAKAKASDRRSGYVLALVAKNFQHKGPQEPIHIKLVFCPPMNRRRDLDNILASCKALLDGVAQGLCVDDHVFRPTLEWGPVIKNGAVILTIVK